MYNKNEQFNYYFNNVPGSGLCRNNLVYTSLINQKKDTFCQWFYNDKFYHKDQNHILDPSLMEEKWIREVTYLKLMSNYYPQHVPRIKKIDEEQKKIFLEISQDDFWQMSNCDLNNFSQTLPDWQEQMLEIIDAHYSLGLHKFSMHPSSFFVVKGKLKSINYFFCFHKDEKKICINDVKSHIHPNRQKELMKFTQKYNIDWSCPQEWTLFDQLCWLSFQTNYPKEFINKIFKRYNLNP
jgi:hypothetical protein